MAGSRLLLRETDADDDHGRGGCQAADAVTAAIAAAITTDQAITETISHHAITYTAESLHTRRLIRVSLYGKLVAVHMQQPACRGK